MSSSSSKSISSEVFLRLNVIQIFPSLCSRVLICGSVYWRSTNGENPSQTNATEGTVVLKKVFRKNFGEEFDSHPISEGFHRHMELEFKDANKGKDSKALASVKFKLLELADICKENSQTHYVIEKKLQLTPTGEITIRAQLIGMKSLEPEHMDPNSTQPRKVTAKRQEKENELQQTTSNQIVADTAPTHDDGWILLMMEDFEVEVDLESDYGLNIDLFTAP